MPLLSPVTIIRISKQYPVEGTAVGTPRERRSGERDNEGHQTHYFPLVPVQRDPEQTEGSCKGEEETKSRT